MSRLNRPLRNRALAVGAVAFFAREVSATLRVGLAAGLGWRGHARLGTHSREDAVVLVHGLMATAGAFSPLVRTLHNELGIDVHSFTYVPGSSLDDIADRIHTLVARLDEPRRIHLIGHSLGGLAARWYVQERVHDRRVVQTISIASPFQGLEVAEYIPEVIRSFVFPPKAQLDRLVQEAARHLPRVPHLSVMAEKDQIFPGHHAMLPGAPSYVLHDTGHNGTLFHGRLHDVLAKEIARYMPVEELGG